MQRESKSKSGAWLKYLTLATLIIGTIAAFIGKQNPHRAAQNSGSRTNYQCEYQNHATGSDQIDQGVYHRTGRMG